MTLFKTIISPRSPFSTALRGDTLFGQLCWAVRYIFGEDRLKELLKDYETSPFCIVSDGFAPGFLPKPSLPSSLINKNNKDAQNEDKKESRKKIWIKKEDLISGDFHKALKDEEANVNGVIDKREEVVHNSINYQTFNTSDKKFAPYTISQLSLTPKEVYILCDIDRFCKDELVKALSFIAQSGYGKDTTIGKGRFDFSDFTKEDFTHTSTTVMALNSFSPKDLECEAIFYEPHTHFGKKGGDRANQNPFKKPLILAATSSIVKFKEPLKKHYIGRAIKGHSSHEDIVHQGYAITLCIKEIQC